MRMSLEERDLCIDTALELSSTGELDIFDMKETVPDSGLYILQVPDYSGELISVYFRKGAQTIFVAALPLGKVNVYTGLLGSIRLPINITEEALFQDSLVNDAYLEYSTLLKIRTLIQYGIDNYNDPRDQQW